MLKPKTNKVIVEVVVVEIQEMARCGIRVRTASRHVWNLDPIGVGRATPLNKHGLGSPMLI